MNENISFEELCSHLENLVIPSKTEDRSVYWVLPMTLGLAKTASARVEVFMCGQKLFPRTSIVRRHLEHGRWKIEGSTDEFDASRVVLPSAPHFISLAAFLAVELIKAGIGSRRSLQEVFDDVEPLFELALLRSALGEEHIIGLLGELLCLEALLDTVANRTETWSAVLDMWRGHEAGQRDFVIGSTSLEIKTTQLESSTHAISGMHQIEVSERYPSEDRLMLLSFGLVSAIQEGQTLPDVVQRILNRLNSGAMELDNNFTPIQQRFIDDVYRYGGVGSRGYDHRTDSKSNVYATRYKSTFTPRLYEMAGEEMLVLRNRDVAGRFIRPNSVQYTIDLPGVISGMNPASNWKHSLVTMVRSYLSIE
ncbi:PD-(D/E)XK motif protein [Burkholderia sp. Ac-20379]|uniref:PD-(D/E)XK motif protein n=1 Tax=Burkholderia sp. Ac-20379 TaxID=2703900 RepID=UPI001981F7C9|nr:PD-(D/E)XK motif protein [Burkholderia sp. Ac-20379]MBN3725171.1 PD-(D/E)XK motif protein [Burkholderia sp. Ac-20379]